jgi:hypothetical protein
MTSGGKGHRPRPYSVDTETFANNWDRIFRSNNALEVTAEEDEAFREIEIQQKEKDVCNSNQR